MRKEVTRIEYVILDKDGIERNYTYSYSRALVFAECLKKQTGTGSIVWKDSRKGIIKEETFIN